MRTRPDAFASVQMSVACEQHIIVKLYDGITTWLFSDTDMQLSDGHVYPLFMADYFEGPGEGIDIMSKEWEGGEVAVSLSNVRYRCNTSSVWVKFSEEAGGLINGTMTIYLAAGRNVAALSDCLVRWIGTILEAPEYDVDRITIRAVDNTILQNIFLPQRYIGDVLGAYDFIDTNKDKKIPIVYGEYTAKASGSDDLFSGLGLALCMLIENRHIDPSYIISDHNILSSVVSGIDCLFDLNSGAIINSGATLTLEENYSSTGATFITAIMGGNILDYFYPNDTPPDDYDASALIPDNSANAHDGNSATQASLLDNIADNGETLDLEGLAVWGITNNDILVNHLFHSSGEFINIDVPIYIWVEQKNITWENTDGYNYPIDDLKIRLYYSRSGSTDIYINMSGILTAGQLGSSSWVAHILRRATDFSSSQDTSLMLAVYAKNETATDISGSPAAAVADGGNSGPDDCHAGGAYSGTPAATFTVEIDGTGTPNTFQWKKDAGSWTTDVNCVSTAPGALMSDGVRVYFESTTGHTLADFWTIDCVALGDEDIVGVGELRLAVQIPYSMPPPIAWLALQGRQFGSWIDGGSRSNSYDEGDLIQDPAFIIESLLRDELGLVDADIDLASFDAAANANVTARLNLHSENEKTLNDIIRQMTEQSTFAFYWSSSGKARLVPLNDSTPTTAARGSHPVKIPYSHIVEGTLRVYKTSHIINHLNIESRYQQEYGDYRDNDLVENATSQSTYGIRKHEARWPNIATTSVDHVADHLVDNADGIWANAHNVIEFEAAGYVGADIEVGDWIELDATTIDPHITVYGTSFSGKQFLVVQTVLGLSATGITAIELY